MRETHPARRLSLKRCCGAAQVAAQFGDPFVADAEGMRREAAQSIEAQIANMPLEPKPPDSKKKKRVRAAARPALEYR